MDEYIRNEIRREERSIKGYRIGSGITIATVAIAIYLNHTLRPFGQPDLLFDATYLGLLVFILVGGVWLSRKKKECIRELERQLEA